MIALVVGALLASLALAFVLFPLFDESAAAQAPIRRSTSPALAPPSPVEALREIEFDRATGKLSDGDYDALKARYTREALAEMRAEARVAEPASVAASSDDDPIEAMIRRQRDHLAACPGCGPRPEPDAAFCSGCGRTLAQSCRGCGAAVTEADARFCAGCGTSLAA